MKLLSLLRDIRRNRRNLVTRPRFLTYLVTFRCNARCVMCDSWKKPSPNELTLPEIEAIFAQLPPMDAVRLSGGEPFLRADLADIARLAARVLRPWFLHVTTNGSLTRRIVEFCEARGRATPLHLLVSLDGTEATHNSIRGRATAWQTAFATVSELAPRQRELGIRLAVNQTIVDRNGAAEHRKLRELLHPLGVPVNAIVAYNQSATYSLDLEQNILPMAAGEFPAFAKLDAADLDVLMKELQVQPQGASFPERLAKRYYFEGIRNRLLHRKGVPNPKCVALNSHLRLFPNGDVSVCQFNSRRVGNLRREKFLELWNSPTAEAERDWVRRCPGCWAECEVLPNAVYSGDGLRYAFTKMIPLRNEGRDDHGHGI